MSSLADVNAAAQSFADAEVLRSFQDFARSAFGIDAAGMSLQQVKREIAQIVLGRPEIRDFYGAAARALGLRPGPKIFTSRDRQCVLLRFGVWSALVDAGWSYSGIAKSSTALHQWDHSTVISAMSRIADLEGVIADQGAKVTAKRKAEEDLAMLRAAERAVRPMASFSDGRE